MPAPPDAVARATRYPYDRPRGSFLFDGSSGSVTAADAAELARWRHDRTPVLAIGSNASPSQLRRKFAGRDTAIPVLAVRLRDHDVVYAARVSAYGAVPVTLTSAPGTCVDVHVTLLDDGALDRMHASEGVGTAYRTVEVDGSLVSCAAPLGGVLVAYEASAGALHVDGAPVACAAIGATGRRLRSWTQVEVLSWVASAHGTGVEALVHAVVTDDDERARVGTWLAARGDRVPWVHGSP